MKSIHTPRIDLRYWAAIALASVFGTNMGDFYAHESGLGIGAGLAVLALLTAVVFGAERFDDARHELYYWLVIIIIRTGATNIADFLAYRVHIPEPALTLGLAAFIALFGWLGVKGAQTAQGLPQTNTAYWLAMLGAGVFGTVLGDIVEHAIGEGIAAIVLFALYAVTLRSVWHRAARLVLFYWLTVAVARTAGTAIGDWFAESKAIGLGLPLCTLLSGVAFAAVILLWKRAAKPGAALSEA
ncbi:hypothetical protein DWU98_10275 [Dyella monticola]|uniref:Membrane-anchored protein n=1 Tax=Dyella monticola TaxID=1927958 RepID=A0A370WZM4_9GAMM|nr:hypothetical protein [Dyella monticola]RDS81608.1 hypothetical protein DWU98_10275 [Dyella monticola]